MESVVESIRGGMTKNHRPMGSRTLPFLKKLLNLRQWSVKVTVCRDRYIIHIIRENRRRKGFNGGWRGYWTGILLENPISMSSWCATFHRQSISKTLLDGRPRAVSYSQISLPHSNYLSRLPPNINIHCLGTSFSELSASWQRFQFSNTTTRPSLIYHNIIFRFQAVSNWHVIPTTQFDKVWLALHLLYQNIYIHRTQCSADV